MTFLHLRTKLRIVVLKDLICSAVRCEAYGDMDAAIHSPPKEALVYIAAHPRSRRAHLFRLVIRRQLTDRFPEA